MLTSFKTTTPRVITVCLDLNQNKVKFWLNDRRNSPKDIVIPPEAGITWTPCVKISQEKNKIILNPFAREPSDFHEREFDRIFTLRKYIMPHLFNFVCITRKEATDSDLEPEQATTKFLQQIKEACKLSSTDLSIVLLPTFFRSDSGTSKQFCFLQLSTTEMVGEVVKAMKAKATEFTVHQNCEIASWYMKDAPL